MTRISRLTSAVKSMVGLECFTRRASMCGCGLFAAWLSIPLSAGFVGCSPRPPSSLFSPSPDLSSSSAEAQAPAPPMPPVSPAPVSIKPNWQRLLVCDQGRTWVDVDLNERRNVQVVSRDFAANQYLASQFVIMTSQTADLSQVTFQLHQDTGIFKTADFNVASSQESVTLKAPVLIGTDYMTQYSVVSRAFRDANNGGLKLEFVRATMQICNFYDADSATCSGNLTYSVRDRYIGNWYFSSCQAVGPSFDSAF